jgi:hypothetical protein
MQKWVGGVAVQDRRIMSGRILDGEVQKAEQQVIDKVKGKMATGQCDGWDNVAKTHVVTSMMTVEHEVSNCITESIESLI